MKRTASITITPTAQESSAIRKACSCSHEVDTVPDTSPGMPRGATRSETVPCSCGGAK